MSFIARSLPREPDTVEQAPRSIDAARAELHALLDRLASAARALDAARFRARLDSSAGGQGARDV